ncbi:hypothetical protein LGQ02_04095 [Bacillus shivajii]|uniref:hypothetical protein n=1 Tax=Bacillus shivajii TaxID=1983719 RepID=UPI001CFC26A5|nr:hypothetical protein [Bacillus shivajii]UCZ53973.1 hypothetical protein LGQ02_04095 [Bacillus shivajii]
MVRITFDDLSIKQIMNSSGVYAGDNIQISYKSTRKINEGMGTTSGDVNIAVNNRHLVMDPDTFDFFLTDND